MNEGAMKKVLVVDDHADTNHILCKLIRKLGYAALSAYSGEGALAVLSAENPDLLILDCMMPGMDGMEVLRRIRTHAPTAGLPVIMYSAVADPEFQKHAIEKGANEYWVKSGFDFSKLKDRLTEYVPAEC
jgi:CheY-like chemotaxis protein